MGAILKLAKAVFGFLGTLIGAIPEIVNAMFERQYPDDADDPKVKEPPQPEPVEKTPQQVLLEAARQFVGEDASPEDVVDDALGCAESVSRVIQCLYPDFPLTVGTYTLYERLSKDHRFKGTLDLVEGNIILSPTGTGNGTIRGHVGVIGEGGRIYSNNSFTGIWELNYTIQSWIDRYRTRGGMKLYVFQPVENPL